MSDETPLSNFPRDNKECPVYITIGNLASKIRQMPPTQSIWMVAQLLMPISNRNIAHEQLDEQRQSNWEVLNWVLQLQIQPVTIKQYPRAESGYYNVLCADGNFRHCKPVIAGWLADCPEYSNLHHLEWHVCFWCEFPINKLGDYVHPDKQHPGLDHNLYRTLSDVDTKEADV